MSYAFNWPFWLQEINNTKSLTLNNTNGNVSLFTVTGHILIWRLEGVVTTVLSSNITGFIFNCTSGASGTINIGGTQTLSSGQVGSAYCLDGSVTTGDVYLRNAGQVNQNTSTGNRAICGVGPITGQTQCTVNFHYATTNTPASGAMKFNMIWSPYIPGTAPVVVAA